MRRLWLLGALPLALLGILAGPARPASAHPLGNFSVNQYEGLSIHPDRIDVSVAVDFAEIPTLQQKSTMDSATECASMASGFEVRAGHDRLQWTVGSVGFEYRPGAGGLQTSRLTCALTSRVSVPTTLTIANHY